MKRHFKLKMVVVEVIDTHETILPREHPVCAAEQDIVFTDKALQQVFYMDAECELRLGRAAHELKEALAVTMSNYLKATK